LLAMKDTRMRAWLKLAFFLPVVLAVLGCRLTTGPQAAEPAPPSVPDSPTPSQTAPPLLPSDTPVPAPSDTPVPAPSDTPPPSPTPEPPHPDRVAFWSNHDGSWQIYLIDVDGSNLRKLVDEATYTYSPPDWSPDGTRIAFISSYASGSNLMVIDIASGAVHQLTTGTPLLGRIAWNPAGTRLAFSASTDYGSEEIFLVNADGSDLTNLTNSEFSDWSPRWSPDGSQIVYQTLAADTWEILSRPTAGGEATHLTSNTDTLWGTNPIWSPDGTRIVFHNGSGSAGEIYTLQLDPYRIHNVSSSSADDSIPSWSPDGSKLLFYSDRDGNEDVFVVLPDGSGLQNLTASPATEWMPGWSPDGTRIVFIRAGDGASTVILMDSDGLNQVALTPPDYYCGFPAWQP